MPSTPTEHHAALRLEYDGTPFRGWTRQPRDQHTIEGTMLAAFARLGCEDVRLRCAGRTDAGVHASAQVVDARYRGSIPPEVIGRALTGRMRREVAVTASVVAPPGFDARAQATSRAYEYRLLTRRVRSPLRDAAVLHHPRPLDRAALDAAAAAVLGTHRFTAFTPTRTAHVFFDRTLSESRWEERGDELVYTIRGNAFLRHMVRVLVGTMLAIGRGEGTIEDLRTMLDGSPRSDAFATAAPNGLCLVDVTWRPMPDLPLPPGWECVLPDGAAHPFSGIG